MFLRRNRVDLVLSEISPLPFEAAECLGIPSVEIPNFTWFTAYQGLMEKVLKGIVREVGAYLKTARFLNRKYVRI
jgi:hypothetical protein